MSQTDECKVDQVSRKYKLDSLDGDLRRRRSDEDASLRDLERYVNGIILKQVMEMNGDGASCGEAKMILTHLRGNKSIPRRETQRKLRELGVDVESLQDDFVSYQTIRKHLNDCIGIDTSREYNPDPDEDIRRIGRLKGRTKRVLNRIVNRLQDHGAIYIGEPETTVSFQIQCGDCEEIYYVSELLHARGCACRENTEK